MKISLFTRLLITVAIGSAVFATVMRAPSATTSSTTASPTPFVSASEITVALVFEPADQARNPTIRPAYTAVLQEEGIPFTWLSTEALSRMSPSDLVRHHPALILPDGLAQTVTPAVAARVDRYVQEGGNAAIVYDAGTRATNQTFRHGALFAPIVGVEYMLYDSLRQGAYGYGSFRFTSAESARYCGIPGGKLIDNQLSGYYYGVLTYPRSAARTLNSNLTMLAADAGTPLMSIDSSGRGKALWVDLPLGALKADGDDLPLRSVLRTLLFRVAHIPHLVNVPGGIGGIIFNWHIDANPELVNLPTFFREGLIRTDLPCQIDVTAGPDCRAPGDGLGFDAAGKGRKLLQTLMTYGEIGSHGGWIHDWFAASLQAGKLSNAEVERLVRLNKDTLEHVTGRHVIIYSAPVNVYPQPLMTHILERFGFLAYYYGGDTGAPPNRTFIDGKMVSSTVWAVPVMPMGKFASFAELSRRGIVGADVQHWHDELLDYLVRERTVRLIYSHPYDIASPENKALIHHLLEREASLKAAGKLSVAATPYFVRFLARLVNTQMRFLRAKDGCTVVLDNREGLKDICVAIPIAWTSTQFRAPNGVDATDGDGYHYLTVRSDASHLEWTLKGPGDMPEAEHRR